MMTKATITVVATTSRVVTLFMLTFLRLPVRIPWSP